MLEATDYSEICETCGTPLLVGCGCNNESDSSEILTQEKTYEQVLNETLQFINKVNEKMEELPGGKKDFKPFLISIAQRLSELRTTLESTTDWETLDHEDPLVSTFILSLNQIKRLADKALETENHSDLIDILSSPDSEREGRHSIEELIELVVK